MHKLGFHTTITSPRLRYTLDFLGGHPLVQGAGIQIELNNAPADNEWNIVYQEASGVADPNYTVPAQRLFFTGRQVPDRLVVNVYEFRGNPVYSVSETAVPSETPLIRDRGFTFDLLETVFFHISRFEEIFAPADRLGDSGWLDEREHLLVRHQVQQVPVVDQLVATLLHVLQGKPVRYNTTYDLSHDIDFLHRYPNFTALLRALGGTLYRRERLSNLITHWRTYRHIITGKKNDPYHCFDWLFSPSDHWQTKRLYLMAGGETPFDNHYQLNDPTIGEMITIARERGYEIGLHPSYNAGFKLSLFANEKERLEEVLEQSVVCSRQHWLRWSWLTTPYILTQLGIREDATLGYRRHLGFRAGTGFPYHLYDFQSEQPFPWRERPLVLMDSAGLHEARTREVDPIELMNTFLESLNVHTHVSINFHNSNFGFLQSQGEGLARFYREGMLHLTA